MGVVRLCFVEDICKVKVSLNVDYMVEENIVYFKVRDIVCI